MRSRASASMCAFMQQGTRGYMDTLRHSHALESYARRHVRLLLVEQNSGQQGAPIHRGLRNGALPFSPVWEVCVSRNANSAALNVEILQPQPSTTKGARLHAHQVCAGGPLFRSRMATGLGLRLRTAIGRMDFFFFDRTKSTSVRSHGVLSAELPVCLRGVGQHNTAAPLSTARCVSQEMPLLQRFHSVKPTSRRRTTCADGSLRVCGVHRHPPHLCRSLGSVCVCVCQAQFWCNGPFPESVAMKINAMSTMTERSF